MTIYQYSQCEVIREKNANIAIAYSTKDRTELTLRTITPLLAQSNIDVYWFDGSTTEEGRSLPELIFKSASVACEIHRGVSGGPDAAILYALQTLQSRGYDWLVLVENDVLLQQGWLEALIKAVNQAEADGYRIGGASARIYDRRVLSANTDYCFLANSGAGFFAIHNQCIDLILKNYRTVLARELTTFFNNFISSDLSNHFEWSYGRVPLSVDYIFDLVLYAHGYGVVGPSRSFAKNIDQLALKTVQSKVVNRVEEHAKEAFASVIPSELLNGQLTPLFQKFQKSLWSDLIFIPIQYLKSSQSLRGKDLINFSGDVHCGWNQTFGPFYLLGFESFTIRSFPGKISICVINRESYDSELVIKSIGTHLAEKRVVVENKTMMEISCQEYEFFPNIIIETSSPGVGILGLAVEVNLVDVYSQSNLNLLFKPSFDTNISVNY